MLLFQKRFHAGILSGAVTTTFRQWPKLRVKVGGRYRVHPLGVVVVDLIERRTLSSITNAEARAAGFDSRDELLDYIAGFTEDSVPDEVWKIDFHYGGEDDRSDAALDATLTEDDVRALREKLAGMDARSEEGPWTRKVLKLIARHPHIAASRLAPKMKMEKPDFKAHVVKLKKLGLTISFEVGYEVSPRGRALLERLDQKRPRRVARTVRSRSK